MGRKIDKKNQKSCEKQHDRNMGLVCGNTSGTSAQKKIVPGMEYFIQERYS